MLVLLSSILSDYPGHEPHTLARRSGPGAHVVSVRKSPSKIPDVFVEPWVMPPRTLRINRTADAGLVAERAHCEVYEEGNFATQLRH